MGSSHTFSEPFVTLSEFQGQVKGASSHEVNARFGGKTLTWQRGYGMVTFSKKYLPGILSYVSNQKEHHARGTTNPVLEQHGDDVGEDEENFGEGGEKMEEEC